MTNVTLSNEVMRFGVTLRISAAGGRYRGPAELYPRPITAGVPELVLVVHLPEQASLDIGSAIL